MVGPCLCGDPYCGSCFPGNDGGAFEEFIDKLSEELQGLDEGECYIFVTTGRAAVEAAKHANAELAAARMEPEIEPEW